MFYKMFAIIDLKIVLVGKVMEMMISQDRMNPLDIKFLSLYLR
jgi:hypothetical protein